MVAGGILSYLRDGTIARIDPYPVEAIERGLDDESEASIHVSAQLADPTFRWRRWAKNGSPIENRTFKVDGLPWATASYENYATLHELDNGDLITALLAQVGSPEVPGEVDRRGRPRLKLNTSTAIIRSRDRGRSWQYVTAFHAADVKPVYGVSDRPVDEGFCEPDITPLPNGDVLCVMRTGSYSPMWQARSTDGGHTWSVPVPTGWQGVKPRLEVLPNGVLACAAGRGAYGHPQVTHVMLSLDGTGEHWEYPFAFHTGPGCSYTSTMVRDGKLHVVYSHSDFHDELGTFGLPSQTIKRAVLDVQLEPA